MTRALLPSIVATVAILFSPPHPTFASPSAQSRCTALAQRLYGADGRSGEVARFRATHDSGEKSRLADAIVADAKFRAALHCPSVQVANVSSPAPLPATVGAITASSPASTSNPSPSPAQTSLATAARGIPTLPPGALGVTTTVRSLHGCVGFNGAWAAPNGLLRITNGSATLGTTTFSGRVSGNVFRGQWTDPSIGTGTFTFALAEDGDSIDAAFVNANGSNGAYGARCSGST